MIEGDPIIQIFIAYKAFIAEHTGLSWEECERFMAADQAFWNARPESREIARRHLSEED
jgi:hypothetical protein